MNMQIKLLWILLAFGLQSCGQNNKQGGTNSLMEFQQEEKHNKYIHLQGMSISERFITPAGFQRKEVTEGSFAQYLRKLPLKPHGAKVLFYNGEEKPAKGIYSAAIDLPIGDKNLHQCADAIIRLRAEYLWSHQQYQRIHFRLTNGFRVDYSEWMKGKRIRVQDNRAWWTDSGEPSNTHRDLQNYLETIYMYAGTLSLERELQSIPATELQPGDVFIQGGSPGHAVIVVDLSINQQTGEKLFLLAQSYMPAQELQILVNPENQQISPWYSLEFGDKLITPEWTFDASDLKRFRQ